MEVFYCNSCKKWITEDQIEVVTVRQATSIDPREDEEHCSFCGGSGEDFDSTDLDSELLCELLNKIEYKL